MQSAGIHDAELIATRLIKTFGSFPAALAASQEHRIAVVGDPAAAALLTAFKGAMSHVQRFRATERPLLGDWRALLDYLRVELAYDQIEQFRVLHLNARHELIRDEIVSHGTIDQAPVHVREVIRRGLELGSASLILVHNHPSGDPTPSREDVSLTATLVEAGRTMGLEVIDHLILAAHRHVSMRGEGYIR